MHCRRIRPIAPTDRPRSALRSAPRCLTVVRRDAHASSLRCLLVRVVCCTSVALQHPPGDRCALERRRRAVLVRSAATADSLAERKGEGGMAVRTISGGSSPSLDCAASSSRKASLRQMRPLQRSAAQRSRPIAAAPTAACWRCSMHTRRHHARDYLVSVVDDCGGIYPTRHGEEVRRWRTCRRGRRPS